MLPIFGPSNERDTVGLAADTAANPLTYVAPYPFSVAQPADLRQSLHLRLLRDLV